MIKTRRTKSPKVTLREFLDIMGRGAAKSMAAEIGISKSTVSNIAIGRQFASYPLAKQIRAHLEAHGYTIDLESMVRTESAAP